MGELKSRILFVCVLVLLLGAPVALGDWDVGDGHKMHYPQLPKPGGWDVAFNFGRLADDWQCSQTGPVEDIHFWVSWEDDMVSPINGFSVRIWSDDPCGPDGYSEPNELLWERDFDAGEFTVRDMPDDLQGWFDPFTGSYEPFDHIMWQQINIEDINDPNLLIQEEGTIYWLEIDMWGAEFCGWKESGSPQFRDDAVGWWSSQWNELIDPEIYESMDLAFVITGEAEEPKEPVPHLKWSQPPIEWDPCLPDPIYCGWDEESYLLPVSTLVYENWDVNGTGVSYAPGQGILMGDDINLAGTERKLDYYDFAVYALDGTAPYTVTSELYTEVMDPCSGYPIPGVPIPGTLCNHNVGFDGYVWLTCSPGPGVILPDNVWMVLEFDTDDAGWWIGEQAEVGYSGDYFALDDGPGWSPYWFGGDPQASFEADIWCESEQYEGLMVADDYRCLGSMPVTSIHWWGSHLWWEEPGSMPPDLPIAWRIGFWSNVPAGNPPDEPDYSYPEKLLWQIEVDANRVEVKEVGIDEYPEIPYYDICYQYYVDLEPNEIFWQGHFLEETIDDIYWLSIAAVYVYDPCDEGPEFPWGWKTRPWSWMDDAVRFWVDENPEPGMVLDPWGVDPIIDPIYGESFDLAFELDTDPNYIKWEQPFTGIRRWPHYEDVWSMADSWEWTETKWSQQPDPTGWDVHFGYHPADDWRCDETGAVDDIHIWFSWKDDVVGNFQSLSVYIYSDDPCGPGGHSEPNEYLWSRIFLPGQFTVSWYGEGDQGWFQPSTPIVERPDHVNYYRIDIEDINDPFIQQEGNIYWLEIGKQCIDGSPGWKTSTDHWNDVAVWKDVDTWHELYDPCTDERLDLAFEITTKKSELDIWSLVADDWPCDQNTPITAAAWWGSYIGYEYAACVGPQPTPPVKPDYFWLTIWDDVPAGTKWTQVPDPCGWDICLCNQVADDFSCTETGPINDIHFWISWMEDIVGDVNNWEVEIWNGKPGEAGAGPVWMWNGIGNVTTSLAGTGPQGYFCQCAGPPYWMYPPNHFNYYKVDIDHIQDPFNQVAGNTYWLVIRGNFNIACAGWKTSQDHSDEDAVYWDMSSEMWKGLIDPCTGISLDLAFEITTSSHPNNIIWEYEAYDYDEVLVGYDKDPRDINVPPREPVFRYSVRLPKDAWFMQQEPNNIYWFSVVAVYDENEPDYDWGWTNHKHVYNDDAVWGYLEPGGPEEEFMWSWHEILDQTYESADMSFILFTDPDECYYGMADYAQWVIVGKPECWCYPRQCHGDADGLPYGLGGLWVSIPDLTILKNAWGKTAGALVGNEACADFDHLPYGLGALRVSIPDLTILKNNWGTSATPADCLPGNETP